MPANGLQIVLALGVKVEKMLQAISIRSYQVPRAPAVTTLPGERLGQCCDR